MSNNNIQNFGPKIEDELQFEIVKESWNEYELEGGVKIRSRIILSKIIKDQNKPNEQILVFLNPIHIVSSPENLLINDSSRIVYNPTAMKPQDLEESEIKKSNEQWNQYKIIADSKTIKIKLIITKIERVRDRCDINGLPYFIITGGPLVDPS
jgi:hypothetical protein